MDLFVEPAVGARTAGEQPGRIAGRSLDEWNSAYTRVESYFHALRVRNRVLLGRLVIHVLNRAMLRAPNEPQRSATQLAAEEMDHLVTHWFAQVLQEVPTGTDQMLSTRGRMALLLADMPDKWQDQFLRPGPWPEQFVKGMREMYLRAGPDFQVSKMVPRQLDLGPITALTNFSRLPYVKMAAVWILFALALAALFVLIHWPWL
jgi:hypothetical protein